MSKNDSLSDSMDGILSIPSKEDGVKLSSGPYINRDEYFKSLIRFKTVAATIIAPIISEFENLSLTDIARLIPTKGVDSKLHPLDQELEMIDRQIGTRDEKAIEFDSAFYINRPNSPNSKLSIDLRYLVNTEMQNVVNTPYDLISRAIYYGASLLQSTVGAGDTNYTGISKVYSIWLCANSLPNLACNDKGDKLEGGLIGQQAIHRFGIRRFYRELPGRVVEAEKSSDLIEVVIVELNKILGLQGIPIQRLSTMFYDTSNFVPTIEKQENVVLPKLKREVREVLDTKKIAKEERELGREEERKKAEQDKVNMALGTIQKFMNLGLNFEEALTEMLEITPLSESSIQYIREKLG